MSSVGTRRGTTVKVRESRVWCRDEAELGNGGGKCRGCLVLHTDRQKNLSVSRMLEKKSWSYRFHNLGSKYQVGLEKTGMMESAVAFLI